MSRSKPLTLARLNDSILGIWGIAPQSQSLDHLLRYLSTWSGTELRLFQIFQWLISLERTPQPTRNLLTIERLQGWSMLGYYPFEHLCYLRIHDVIPATVPSPASLLNPAAKPIKLDSSTLSLWSCRCWASYVILQFAHLREDRKLLQLQQRTLRKGKGGVLTAAEKQDLARRWDAYWSGLLVNTCNLPLALHWSIEGGLIKNPVLVDILGLITAVASFRSGWNATALPSTAPQEISDLVAPPIDLGEIAAGGLIVLRGV
ncbi:TPR-REGION domain-containing protein [Mycena sanguinolenta]|uniref:TPR-REGION domain-containing protein n=1 Tax=Mycena sanguinolenta TaxID=230812 RepID=A0A8H6ZCN2_9AGAR|nr:TPR-REGION domain-containing protein [Mycena sanguinolenta]